MLKLNNFWFGYHKSINFTHLYIVVHVRDY